MLFGRVSGQLLELLTVWLTHFPGVPLSLGETPFPSSQERQQVVWDSSPWGLPIPGSIAAGRAKWARWLICLSSLSHFYESYTFILSKVWESNIKHVTLRCCYQIFAWKKKNPPLIWSFQKMSIWAFHCVAISQVTKKAGGRGNGAGV